MFKSIFKVSVVTAVVLFSGCGGSNGSSNISLPTVSDDAKTLAISIMGQNSITDTVALSGGKSIRSEDTEPTRKNIQECINGGSMTFESKNPYKFADINLTQEDMQNFTTSTKMSFDNCVEGGMTTNGSMQISNTLDGKSYVTTIKYLTDFIVNDDSDSFKIYKDSSIDTAMSDSGKMIVTESIRADVSGKEYYTKDLKVAISMSGESESFYFISGEELINGKTYRVDESYDSSATPFVIDDDGFKKGGVAKFIGENSHITIEVKKNDEIIVSEDIDNDGKADKREVIKL